MNSLNYFCFVNFVSLCKCPFGDYIDKYMATLASCKSSDIG